MQPYALLHACASYNFRYSKATVLCTKFINFMRIMLVKCQLHKFVSHKYTTLYNITKLLINA